MLDCLPSWGVQAVSVLFSWLVLAVWFVMMMMMMMMMMMIVNEALCYYRRDNPFQGPKEAYPWCL